MCNTHDSFECVCLIFLPVAVRVRIDSILWLRHCVNSTPTLDSVVDLGVLFPPPPLRSAALADRLCMAATWWLAVSPSAAPLRNECSNTEKNIYQLFNVNYMKKISVYVEI